MRDEFMITRQGKQYVLFAGLLDEAHKRGLKRIETEPLAFPWENDHNCAVALATVETESGVFTGIGDASPSNVGKNIAEHIIRMAETRAKARALRDAVNVGTTALEELGDGDGSVPAASSESVPDVSQYRGQAQRAKQGAAQSASGNRGGSGGGDAGEQPATKKQLNFLEALISDSADWESVDEWEESHQLLETLTRAEASAAIKALQA